MTRSEMLWSTSPAAVREALPWTKRRVVWSTSPWSLYALHVYAPLSSLVMPRMVRLPSCTFRSETKETASSFFLVFQVFMCAVYAKANNAAYSRVVAADVKQKSHWSSRSIKYLSFLGTSVPPDSTNGKAPAVIKQFIVIMKKSKVSIRRFWEKVGDVWRRVRFRVEIGPKENPTRSKQDTYLN